MITEVPVLVTDESILPRSCVEEGFKKLEALNIQEDRVEATVEATVETPVVETTVEAPAINIKLLSPGAKLPTRSYHSAGYDLYACRETKCPPGQVTMVPIGIATSFPAGHAALVWDRSGMGKKGLTVFGGVIDEDYRGEWFVMLYNSTPNAYPVHAGDRVAQFVLQEVKQVAVEQVEELSETVRGADGFSSTGR